MPPCCVYTTAESQPRFAKSRGLQRSKHMTPRVEMHFRGSTWLGSCKGSELKNGAELRRVSCADVAFWSLHAVHRNQCPIPTSHKTNQTRQTNNANGTPADCTCCPSAPPVDRQTSLIRHRQTSLIAMKDGDPRQTRRRRQAKTDCRLPREAASLYSQYSHRRFDSGGQVGSDGGRQRGHAAAELTEEAGGPVGDLETPPLCRHYPETMRISGHITTRHRGGGRGVHAPAPAVGVPV